MRMCHTLTHTHDVLCTAWVTQYIIVMFPNTLRIFPTYYRCFLPITRMCLLLNDGGM
jgi:hypothetical protein